MRKFFTFFVGYNSYLIFALYCTIATLFIKLEDDDIVTKLRSSGMEFSAVINEKLVSFGYLLNLKTENERLMQVNTDLLSRVVTLETAAMDERNRKKILQDSTFNASGFTIARVVDRKFSDRENMLLIDAGWKKGIKKDMTVLTPAGLVGRVVSVSENYAKVMPIIHSDFKVVAISDKNNIMGVLGWNGGSESLAQLEHVPISTPLSLHERIVTSDFSTFSMRGIPVGEVVRIVPDKLFYTVDVRLAVDFSSLSQVLVAPLKREPEKVEMSNGSISNEEFP